MEALRTELTALPAPHPARRSLKGIQAWIETNWAKRLSRETVRAALQRIQWTYHKAKKLLVKASSSRRREHQCKMKDFLADAMWGRRTLVFADEAHLHQDVDVGRCWGPRGERMFIASPSLSLNARVTVFGFYLYNDGEILLIPADRANQLTTITALQALRQRYPDNRPLTLIWDGASYHRAKAVLAEAERLHIEIVPLPGYSPDLMPVEELWRWFRDDVARNTVFPTRKDLIDALKAFQQRLNSSGYEIADRLVVIEDLDPEYEKLLAS